MKRVRIQSILRRGLLLALFTAMFSICIKDRAKAETADDLKNLIGIEHEERNVGSVYNNDTVNIRSERAKNDLVDAVNKLKLKEAELELNIKVGTTESILMNIREISSIKGKVEQSKKEYESTLIVESTIKSALDYIKDIGINTDVDLNASDYNIGDIGTNAIYPVEDMKIVTPYGYKVNSDGTLSKKHEAIDIRANANNDIYCQWNGEVVSIEDDKDIQGLKEITVYHGNSIFTIYSHVIPKNVVVGSLVKQGSVIATAGVTTNYNPSKENYITYKIIVDNRYINPILIYAKDSEKLYNDWYDTAYEKYVLDAGEFPYYQSSLSIKPLEKSIENTIEGAADIEQGFDVPRTGAVQHKARDYGS